MVLMYPGALGWTLVLVGGCVVWLVLSLGKCSNAILVCSAHLFESWGGGLAIGGRLLPGSPLCGGRGSWSPLFLTRAVIVDSCQPMWTLMLKMLNSGPSLLSWHMFTLSFYWLMEGCWPAEIVCLHSGIGCWLPGVQMLAL